MRCNLSYIEFIKNKVSHKEAFNYLICYKFSQKYLATSTWYPATMSVLAMKIMRKSSAPLPPAMKTCGNVVQNELVVLFFPQANYLSHVAESVLASVGLHQISIIVIGI